MWDGVGLVKMPIYAITAVKINHQVFLSISHLPVRCGNGNLQAIKNMEIMMQQEGTQHLNNIFLEIYATSVFPQLFRKWLSLM